MSGAGSSTIAGLVDDVVDAAGLPGLAGAVVQAGARVFSFARGCADLASARPMTVDTTLNVASVTKTVTATAIVQLWEAGRIDLDADISPYVGMQIRNPAYPQSPLTVRHLLTPRSSIADGPAYAMSYSCGEPGSVAEWLAAYLTPAGSLFDVNHNFAPWPPGDRRAYSNVGYGLLGLAVETVSGRPFGRYCREQILAPLGMSARTFDAPSTSAAHATAYSMTDRSAVAAVRLRDPDAQPLPASRGRVYVAHCLYSFPTVADGLLRTTANDLAQFVGAFTGGGAVGAERILRPRTVRRMFSTDGLGRSGASGRTGLSEHVQGIAWQRFDLPGPPVWGHGGSDPGVSALVLVRPATRTGVVLMSNVGGAEAALRSLGQRLLDHGHRP